MLGEKVHETTAKITGTRVIPTEGEAGIRVEISFHGVGKLLGVETTEIGTYQADARPTGVLHGQGQGLIITKDGDRAIWHAIGVGKPTGKGLSASWRYSLRLESTSNKWSRLNGLLLVGEWETDENGNAKGTATEWK